MCGVISLKIKQGNVSNIDTIFNEALSSMEYRGPDNTAVYKHDNVFFGHTRLSVNDLSSSSNQPFVSDSKVMLFNGEIYNFREIDNASKSDTKTLFNLIEEKKDFLNYIDGAYAILTYDKLTQEIKVNRDLYGERPLYYYDDEDIFIVSSTIKSITFILKSLKKEVNIDKVSIDQYLLFGFIKEPRTIFQNIHSLNSGFELTLSAENLLKVVSKVETYKYSTPSDKYIYNTFVSTDLKPTLLLSSGVDSTYLLHQIVKNNIDTNILVYESMNRDKNESEVAKKNINKINKNLNSKLQIIKGIKDINTLFDSFISIMEQPSIDGMNLFNIIKGTTKEYRDNSKVIVTGIGADELYGGYNSFKNYKKISKLRGLLFLLKPFLNKKYKRFTFINDKKNKELSYYFLYRLDYKLVELLDIKKTTIISIYKDFITHMSQYLKTNSSPLMKIKYAELFDYMKNQLLRDSDNITMHFGMEARSPLLCYKCLQQEPDYKNFMKKDLKDNYFIEFSQKRGFSLSEENKILNNKIYNEIIEINGDYNLFDLKNITSNTDYTILKKLYILLRWLKYNNVNKDFSV